MVNQTQKSGNDNGQAIYIRKDRGGCPAREGGNGGQGIGALEPVRKQHKSN